MARRVDRAGYTWSWQLGVDMMVRWRVDVLDFKIVTRDLTIYGR